MPKIHRDEKGMITDFRDLKYLDSSRSSFFCKTRFLLSLGLAGISDSKS